MAKVVTILAFIMVAALNAIVYARGGGLIYLFIMVLWLGAAGHQIIKED